MLQAFVRVKPVSLGKLYAVYVGLVVFIMGLAFDFVAMVFGRNSLTLTLQTMMGPTPMQQEIILNPWQILLLTCLATLVVMVLGFFYGILLSLLYNLSANITGGVVIESTTVGTAVKSATTVSVQTPSPSSVSGSVAKSTKPAAHTKSTATRTVSRKKRKA